MMILSRVWYLILALVAGAAIYVVSLAVGQFNRRAFSAASEQVKGDSQVVKWALDIDARRRLDNLLKVTVEKPLIDSLKAANGKEIPAKSKEEAKKVLDAFQQAKGPAEYRNDSIFAVDRDGRIVAQLGYEQASGFVDFDLGGYPAVYDALHGFLRDDTWVWGDRVGRVVARPVEDEAGAAPVGAVVAIRWMSDATAKELAKRTRSNVVFFANGKRAAMGSWSDEKDENDTLELLTADEIARVLEEKEFKDGRTGVRQLGPAGKSSAIFVKMQGEAWDLGAGFGVIRTPASIASPVDFVSGADDKDKATVKWWLVALVVVLGLGVGFLFSFLEHSVPLKGMLKQTDLLKRGTIDRYQLANLRSVFRAMGESVNVAIERGIEKSGGQGKKPADLESILGPVPAQPAMSAFSFPLPESGAGAAIPQVPSGPGAAPPGSGPGGQPAPDMVPLAQRFANVAKGPGGAPAAPPAGPPPAPRVGPGSSPGGPPPSVRTHEVSVAPSGAQGNGAVTAGSDETTMVGQVSPEVLAAEKHGGHENAEWHAVYEDFIRVKKECGESVDGLTFEKFQGTLRKNRDALVSKHNCKRVKFSVYVKEGRASLKATPVRD